MFHLKFKHTWHLKWNRSESMHWTFRKGSLSLCKQKPMLFFMALYLLKLISHGKSQNSSVCRCLPAQCYWEGSSPWQDPCSHSAEGSLPFLRLTSVLIHIQAGERKLSRLQTAAIMGYPFLEAGENQQFCQDSSLLLASSARGQRLNRLRHI